MIGNLINDLMDLAKLENSCFKFDEDHFNLMSVLHNALNIVFFSAKSRRIRLRTTVDSTDSLMYLQRVWGDERRLLQIILNFLTNAIKFTEREGTVSIDLKI